MCDIFQSLVLVESAARVGQRGSITRVVSGCERAKSLTDEPQMDPYQIRRDHEIMANHSYYPFHFNLHFVHDLTIVHAPSGNRGQLG